MVTPRFRHINVRRRAIRAASLRLHKRAARGLAAFARAERLGPRGAAFRLAQLAHVHRSAELRLGRPIVASPLVRAAIKAGAVNEELCAWLAKAHPGMDGAAWGAWAYSSLVIARERRDRGQFFTPEPMARAMAAWVITSKDARVLDPGSGPGQLLASSAARLSELGSASPGSQIVGVELSPLAPTFGALALRDARVRVVCADFLTGFRARPGTFDAVIANPPYSRHQALASAYKERIGRIADRLTGAHLHRSAGVYVHFLLRSLDLLRDGGRLAFLTPRDFFDARYGRVVREHLLKRTRLRALVVFDPAVTAAFEGVLTTSAITLLENGSPDRAAVRLVHVRRMPTGAQLLGALGEDAKPGERAWGSIEDVPFALVERAARWSALLPGRGSATDGRRFVRLGELVDVKRGIATGANQFFVLSKAEADSHGLRNGSLRPAIARAHLAKMERITKATFERWSQQGERVWLLDIRHQKLTLPEREYLRTGVDQALDQRTLSTMREPWYRMERRDPPPILVTYMSKRAPRFVRNEAGLVPLNVFHGIYPKELTPRQVDALYAHLTSEQFQRRLRRAVRTYGAGLVKIEPRELAAVMVRDVRGAAGARRISDPTRNSQRSTGAEGAELCLTPGRQEDGNSHRGTSSTWN